MIVEFQRQSVQGVRQLGKLGRSMLRPYKGWSSAVDYAGYGVALFAPGVEAAL